VRWTPDTFFPDLELPQIFQRVFFRRSVYLKSILDEAVELEFIVKNPAARIAVPSSTKGKGRLRTEKFSNTID